MSLAVAAEAKTDKDERDEAIKRAEAQLYSYTTYAAQYRARLRYLEDLATSHPSPGSGDEPVDGGTMPVPDSQRAVELVERDRTLRVLGCRIGAIDEATGLLKEFHPDLWRIVDLRYFREHSLAEVANEMGVTERTCRRYRDMALRKVFLVMAALPRDIWDESILG